MDLNIRGINASELNTFSSILIEATEWVNSTGQELWDINDITNEGLLKSYTIEEMYLACINNEEAATVILQEEDHIYWPHEKNSDSLYLHKLAIRRKFAKTGLSEQVLSWAKSEAKHHNKQYLRLDCLANRSKLCHFYEAQGFKKIKQEEINHHLVAFYEYKIL
ncbi:GNAT family N-acetyltransferase [Bacillus massiliigorillae]|uniref:GNAT family N-acetyltransferase n=1 Tax=Bacillus massiliigorillae TaxID=1243664 RepID=UPI0003A78EB8|nr:GNAT family N-acetyltransferase [Bacillus massiliigorillae]